MGDEELMKSLRQSIKEAQEGKTIPWETRKGNSRLDVRHPDHAYGP